MSTVYLTKPKIPSLAALEAGLPKGITVHGRRSIYTTPHFTLTDGVNIIHAWEPTLEWLGKYHPPAIMQVCFERYGYNKVAPIFAKLTEAFRVTFTDEYGIDLHPDD